MRIRAELHTFWILLRRAGIDSYRDNCFGIAKGAAYSALLSFFPVFTTLTAILVQAHAHAVSRSLSRVMFQVVPPGTEEIVMQIFTQRGHRPGYLLFGATLLSIWAASGLMLSLMEGFRAAYGIPKGRPFLHGRAVAALLVVVVGFPFVLASAAIVIGGRAEEWVLQGIGVLPRGQDLKGWVSLLAYVIRLLFSFGSIILGTSLLYCIGPNPPRQIHRVFPGALLAGCFWWITTQGFGWYVRNIANYNVLYGSVGAVMALLVWMYLLSVIALFGCEFNAARDRLRARK